jgi:hypothetical protein
MKIRAAQASVRGIGSAAALRARIRLIRFALSLSFRFSREVMRMQIMHPRARRYEFTARIEVTDLQTEQQTSERTINVSLYGCSVHTSKLILSGTKISLRITHEGESFAALGKIAYCGRNGEAGIAFTRVQPNDQLILEKWITELREGRHHSMC